MTYEVHLTDSEKDIFVGITFGNDVGSWIKSNDQSRVIGKELVKTMQKRSKNSRTAMSRPKRWMKLITSIATKYNLEMTTWGTY